MAERNKAVQNCERCDFNEDGRCHVDPPRSTHPNWSFFPVVDCNDWCSKFDNYDDDVKQQQQEIQEVQQKMAQVMVRLRPTPKGPAQ